MKLFFKMQILIIKHEKDLKKQATSLRAFCKFFDLHLEVSPLHDDTFYALLPTDLFQLCEVINALEAYCYFHDIACRISSERIVLPFDEFVKNLNDSAFWARNSTDD